jgi:hypothetical protein
MRCAASALAVVACGHSEPFVSGPHETTGAFVGGTPIQLTYSPLSDYEPAFSVDGQWITYQFERGTPDRDRCLAIIPAAGGTRRRELCPWALEQASRAEGLAAAVLLPDDRMFFAFHSGLPINLTSTQAGLYLGPSDSVAGAAKQLDLLGRPPGATAVWSHVMDPIAIGPDEILLLAGGRHLVNSDSCSSPECIPPRPRDRDRTAIRDTIPLGRELAWLRITESGLSITRVRPVPEAIAWSVDTAAGLVTIVTQAVATNPDDGQYFHESVADSVWSQPIDGGALALRYATDPAHLVRRMERIHGVATGFGRLFLSRSWRHPSDMPQGTAPVPIGTPLQSDIIEVLSDGSVRIVAPAVSWRWGALRLSPDGRSLLAEALERTSSDIYLIRLDS